MNFSLDPSTTIAPPDTPKTSIRSRSRLASLGWMLFGLMFALSGAIFAGIWTANEIEGSTDDYAGLLYVVTVPAGYIAGGILGTIAARYIERDEPTIGDGMSRTWLAFLGPVAPIGTLIVLNLMAAAIAG